jgi:hypothetical protein
MQTSHGYQEVMHLAMLFLYPEKAKSKYKINEFKSEIMFNPENTKKIIETVDYSLITSKLYREVLKRFKLWKISDLKNDPLVSPFV